jgi:hypothetical protein
LDDTRSGNRGRGSGHGDEIPRNPLAKVVLLIQPVWPDSARPPLLHSCNARSRRGETKIVPNVRAEIIRGPEYTEEVCPCGSSRVLRGGQPFGKWLYRNAARWHRDWPTREENMLDAHPKGFVKYI